MAHSSKRIYVLTASTTERFILALYWIIELKGMTPNELHKYTDI